MELCCASAPTEQRTIAIEPFRPLSGATPQSEQKRVEWPRSVFNVNLSNPGATVRARKLAKPIRSETVNLTGQMDCAFGDP